MVDLCAPFTPFSARLWKEWTVLPTQVMWLQCRIQGRRRRPLHLGTWPHDPALVTEEWETCMSPVSAYPVLQPAFTARFYTFLHIQYCALVFFTLIYLYKFCLRCLFYDVLKRFSENDFFRFTNFFNKSYMLEVTYYGLVHINPDRSENNIFWKRLHRHGCYFPLRLPCGLLPAAKSQPCRYSV